MAERRSFKREVLSDCSGGVVYFVSYCEININGEKITFTFIIIIIIIMNEGKFIV